MGTRSLTMVYMDGQYRVAQYGQWDGYPEGQGITCLHFVRDEMNEGKFREEIRKIRYMDRRDISAIWKEFGADEEGMISYKDADRLKKVYPELSRDTAALILDLIQNGLIKAPGLQNDLEFAADGLFCEWAYVIDMDKRTLEVFKGFNVNPLEENDRFYFLKENEYGKYHGVKISHSWRLEELPTDEDFVNAFKEEEEDE